MFGHKILWQVIVKLKEDVFKSEQRIKKLEKPNGEMCEGCGCFVFTERAIKGKSEIRERGAGIYSVMPPEEYIHTPYYCGRCAPKPGHITVTFYSKDEKNMEKLIKSKAREIAERVRYEGSEGK